MPQQIEAPTEADIGRIARQLIHADELIQAVTGEAPCRQVGDLTLIQRVLDSRQLEPEATYSLQALGMAFGAVFVKNNEGYDWWMVEDEYGRDPTVRYRQTTLLAFPMTMISKRVEDGEPVDVLDLYSGLVQRLKTLREEGYT